MKFAASLNFNDRAADSALAYIVLHYTGMQDAQSALSHMRDPASEVSAHYMIFEDGDVIQLVDETKRAWHAGKSLWRGITDMNSASIGIELVNPGHEFGYRAFPAAQIAALTELMRGIVTRHKMSPILAPVAHSDIAPTRKQDPGELFPWQLLAQQGLGLWPQPLANDFAPASDADIPTMLDLIGYDTASLPETVLAFQRRFYPENLTGVADEGTVARMRALIRQLKG